MNKSNNKEKTLYEILIEKIDSLYNCYVEQKLNGLNVESLRGNIMTVATELFNKCRFVFNFDKRYTSKSDYRGDECFGVEIVRGVDDALKSFKSSSLKNKKESHFSSYLIVCVKNKINSHISYEESEFGRLGLSFSKHKNEKETSPNVDTEEKTRKLRTRLKKYKECFKIFDHLYKGNIEKINDGIKKQMALSLEDVEELYELMNLSSSSLVMKKEGDEKDFSPLDAKMSESSNKRTTEEEEKVLDEENSNIEYLFREIEKVYNNEKESNKECLRSVITRDVIKMFKEADENNSSVLFHQSYQELKGIDIFHLIQNYSFCDKQMINEYLKTFSIAVDKDLASRFGYKDRQGINKVSKRFWEKVKSSENIKKRARENKILKTD